MNQRPPRPRSLRSGGVTLVETLVALAVVGLGVLLLAPALLKTRGEANRTHCGNNLKQIGLAALQYSDDKRWFPHVAAISSLDGGYDSNTAARCLRSLVHFNYLDNPESFVCPSGIDSPAPLTTRQKMDIRLWSWKENADAEDATKPPLVREDVNDRALNDPEMTTLSYGWTRRGLTSNTMSSIALAGDKARRQHDDQGFSPYHDAHYGPMIGNHEDCMLIVATDAHTQRLTPNSDGLNTGSSSASISGTANGGDGYLGVLADE